MDPERSLELLGLVLCLVLAAISSAADAALTAISRHRLQSLIAESQPRAQLVSRFLDDPGRFRATTLTLNISAAVLATALTLALLHPWAVWWQPVLGLVGLLLLLLVVGEAIPKVLATLNPDRAALLLARPLQVLAVVLVPFIWSTNLFMRLFVGKDNVGHGNALVSEEELKMLVNVGAEEGLIEKDEREMIESILVFDNTLVREVMVPRVDMVALDSGATVAEALDQALAGGHSRIPVYQDTIDNIAGILYVRDLLPLLRDGELSRKISDLARPVYYVPETMKVDDLLRSLKTRKVHLAVVVDEYGGTAGIVTIEDLLEEIVGEIQDEYDVDEPAINQVDPHTWIVDARVSLDDLNAETGLQLETEEGDSVGGLVYEQLGSIPQAGDSLDVDNVTITVQSVQGVRPEKLQIVVKEPEDE
ncbi:MAG: hemolysin family protein, partial [Chloroflexota bacterium]|nr:hemolysin family protein [Chloroflexota bacterium]